MEYSPFERKKELLVSTALDLETVKAPNRCIFIVQNFKKCLLIFLMLRCEEEKVSSDGNGVNIQLFHITYNSILVVLSKSPHSRAQAGVSLCIVSSQ